MQAEWYAYSLLNGKTLPQFFLFKRVEWQVKEPPAIGMIVPLGSILKQGVITHVERYKNLIKLYVGIEKRQDVIQECCDCPE